MTFSMVLTNRLENTKIDHSLRLLKACFEINATREEPCIVHVHTHGVSGMTVCIMVQQDNHRSKPHHKG